MTPALGHGMPDAPTPVRLPMDDPLVARLASWRRERARAERAPPYRVLPNATLVDIARVRPESLSELRRVRGVGPVRLERYGLEIMRLLRSSEREAAEP